VPVVFAFLTLGSGAKAASTGGVDGTVVTSDGKPIGDARVVLAPARRATATMPPSGGTSS
jgi:hypothetical protein